jgi:hypothetical protein
VDYQRDKPRQQQQQHANIQQQPPASSMQPTSPSAVELVQLSVLWQCLEVTFFYEHCLLLIRREAFDRDKRCECWAGVGGFWFTAVSKQ